MRDLFAEFDQTKIYIANRVYLLSSLCSLTRAISIVTNVDRYNERNRAYFSFRTGGFSCDDRRVGGRESNKKETSKGMKRPFNLDQS